VPQHRDVAEIGRRHPNRTQEILLAHRSWLISRISGRGNTGRVAATRRTAAAGMFSNSKVATSIAAANRRNAPVSA